MSDALERPFRVSFARPPTTKVLPTTLTVAADMLDQITEKLSERATKS